MESRPLDRVRTRCGEVAQQSGHVRIMHHAIQPYAASLPSDQPTRPTMDSSCHLLGGGDATVAFFLTLDAINFGSGYFPHLRKRPGMSGYFTVASSLKDYYEQHGPPSAEELTQFSAENCAGIFDQDLEHPVTRELMRLFATALNDLGAYLLERFEGSFLGLVQAAGGSAERLVELLIEMPYFNDVASYNGLDVPFYKRAQITAADLSLAFDGKGPGRFDDLERLTVFADNLVPHVLRLDGILRYDDSLAADIEAGVLIQSGSPREVEIRACAVHAVECLADVLQEAGRSVTAMGLDYLLWNRGQQPAYKARPRHRTRSVFY